MLITSGEPYTLKGVHTVREGDTGRSVDKRQIFISNG